VAEDLTELTRADFRQSVRRARQPVVVVFTAEWAEQAEAYEDVLEQMQDDYGDQVDLFRVDVDDEGRLANEFHIADVPTFIGFYHGNVLFRSESGDFDEPADASDVAQKLIDLPGIAA
jgi:thioredoxin 1